MIRFPIIPARTMTTVTAPKEARKGSIPASKAILPAFTNTNGQANRAKARIINSDFMIF